MRKVILLAWGIFLLLTGKIYSQEKYTEEFGRVTQYEMSMTEYENDKDAEALVIYDLGQNYFYGDDSRGFLLVKKKSFKIKILKQAGIEYANIEIPYYVDDNHNGFEEIRNVEARTYNYTNATLTKTEFDAKKIFDEKINEKWNVKKFAMPDVKEGSVIEVKYEIVTPFYFNMGEWNFQKRIPVVHSKLEYRAIPYYEYTYIAKGINKFDEYSSKVINNDVRFGNLLYREMSYVFGLKDIPAFRDEEFISSPQNYMISLNFQLSKYNFPRGGSKEIMTTWPQMIKDFSKEDNFGKYIKNAQKESKKILPDLELSGLTPLEQTKAISSYVKRTYNWNEFNSKFAMVSLSDFMKQKKGNSANINLLLIGLLQGAGIDAKPVVLSTRRHGAISKDHPFEYFFNYVIAEVSIGNEMYYIDATESLLPFGELPERCIHVEGLVIDTDSKEERWVITSQETLATTAKKFNIKLLPNENKMDVHAKYVSSGYNAYNYRSVYLGKTENLQNYLHKRNNIETKDKIKVSDKSLDESFDFSFSFDMSLESTPDKIFIKPFCNLSITDNPFKQTSRSLPVDLLYFKGETYTSEIEIPEGYKVEYLPRNSKINNKMISLNYLAQEVDGKIEVKAGYKMNKNIYAANEYLVLKNIFTSMIQRFSEMIVLVKMKEE